MGRERYPIPNDTPTEYLPMPPDLEGYWWETEHLICVPLVESRRMGACQQWLRTLEGKNKIIFIPTVVNHAFEQRLRKHGYIDAFAEDEEMGMVAGLAYVPGGEVNVPANCLKCSAHHISGGVMSYATYLHCMELLAPNLIATWHTRERKRVKPSPQCPRREVQQ